MRCLVIDNSHYPLVSEYIAWLQAHHHSVQHQSVTDPITPRPYVGKDAVIFLASPNKAQTSDMVLATWRAILEGCLQHQVSHVIYGSSAAVYGNPDNEKWAEWLPLTPTCALGLHHAMAEQLAAYYARKGLKITCLRYFLAQTAKKEASQSNLSTKKAAEATGLALKRTLGERFEAINVCVASTTKPNPTLPAIYWFSPNEGQLVYKGDPAKAFHLLGFYTKSKNLPILREENQAKPLHSQRG